MPDETRIVGLLEIRSVSVTGLKLMVVEALLLLTPEVDRTLVVYVAPSTLAVATEINEDMS